MVQGTYEVVNKEKYVGAKSPRYLSSWELHVCKFLDHHDSVIEWGGDETVVIPYFDPTRQRKRRYMVDIYMKVKNRKGEIKTYLVEIKPKKETLPPTKTSRKRQDVFESEQNTFIVNSCKWQAARKYAAERGWDFIILTEYEIFKH